MRKSSTRFALHSEWRRRVPVDGSRIAYGNRRETGSVSYQRRFYSPVLGRWLNRDLIEEEGGENLYCFCMNSSAIYFDAFGKNANQYPVDTYFF